MARSIAFLSCALAVGCAGVKEASPDASKPLPPPSVDSFSTGSPPGLPDTPPAPSQPEAKRDTKSDTPPAPSTTAPAKKPAAAKEAATKAEPPVRAVQQTETHAATGSAPRTAALAKADSKAGAAKPMVAEPARPESVPVARIPEPTLDVADLKARLRETSAIGTFTKLALKNQMDDLLDRFRAFYQSGQKTGVSALRQPFDTLVVKVLTQLRPGDPTLARTIESSREAIWGILADPEKFKSVT